MAPIFVGPTDDNSKIRDNRVGFAISTANPGTASEGDVYFNSSDSGLRAYDGSAWSAVGAGGGTYSGIASGAISNGDPIIVGTGGTLGIISSTNFTEAYGALQTWYNAAAYRIESVYHETEDKVVIVYQDGSDSNKGKVKLGTVSGTSISFGSASTFNSGITMPLGVAYDPDEEKIIIAYVGDDPYHGNAIVGNVSGGSVTYGSPVTFNAASTSSSGGVTYDSNAKKVVIAFEDDGDSEKGKAIVGTVSGTSISFGSEVEFESGRVTVGRPGFDASNNRIVIPYSDRDDSEKGKAVVGTVSGTSISFGSPQVFSTSNTGTEFEAKYHPPSGNMVIDFVDDTDSGHGYVIVGSVDSSDNSMSFGTAVEFANYNTYYLGLAYDADAQKFFLGHSDYTNSLSKYAVFTVSGTTPTMLSTGTQIVSHNSSHVTSVVDTSSKRTVMVFTSTGAGYFSQGRAVVFRHAFLDTNLTSTNFVGFADANYSDGATAKVQIVGSIDDAQTGLTTGSIHYVQKDGTLSTSAGTPSVLAGIALTDTKILIRK